jgi:hypothetical protein
VNDVIVIEGAGVAPKSTSSKGIREYGIAKLAQAPFYLLAIWTAAEYLHSFSASVALSITDEQNIRKSTGHHKFRVMCHCSNLACVN